MAAICNGALNISQCAAAMSAAESNEFTNKMFLVAASFFLLGATTVYWSVDKILSNLNINKTQSNGYQ